MGVHSFEDLRVYQQAEAMADVIWDIVLAWNSLSKDTVGKQMIRSADSIGANIAEGHGRGTYAENRRFVRISRGSLYERATGSAELTVGSCSQKSKSINSKIW